MRIISKSSLRAFWERPKHGTAREPLTRWCDIVESSGWKDTAGVKASFGVNVDFVQVESGNTVAVFDAGGNKYRIVAAIHFQPIHFAKGRVYVLSVLDHREYDRMKWVEAL
ncbi:MAG: type II toxin-antitoxin system HigB family toxin [Tepidisphaeraceae bacterium]